MSNCSLARLHTEYCIVVLVTRDATCNVHKYSCYIAQRLSVRHRIWEYRLEMRCLYVSHALECVIIAVGISIISLLHGVSACAYHH